MINELTCFCDEWGLSVNMTKTAVLIFNYSGRQLKESHEFLYGSTTIPSEKSYCYLGITFSLSGSLKVTQQSLRVKGLRAYFSLKNTIDITSISKEAVFKLFDALVLPVVSYGCSVWLVKTNIFNCFSNEVNTLDDVLGKIMKDPIEKLHMSFLKWTLGVGKRTSTAAIWGDCDRIPLGIILMKQLIDYHNRLALMDGCDSNQLVRHAFVEQRLLHLSWFEKNQEIATKFDPGAKNHSTKHSIQQLPNSTLVRQRLSDWFKTEWNEARKTNNKLRFYNSVKDSYGLEPYLYLAGSTTANSRFVAKIRSSSHQLNIETGR